MDFPHQVKDLRNLPNSTGVAFDLALGDYSHGDVNSDWGGYGERPSDELVDGLLGELALERREVEPVWDCASVLKTLKGTAKHLGMHDVEAFCAATIWLLDGWDKPASADVDLTRKRGRGKGKV